MTLNELVEKLVNIQITEPEHQNDEVFIQTSDGDSEVGDVEFVEATDTDEACVIVKVGVSV